MILSSYLLTVLHISTLLSLVQTIRFPYYSPDTYPDSFRDFRSCGLPWRSLVCDADGVLDEEGRLLLDKSTRLIENNTKCGCAPQDGPFGSCLEDKGYRISVAILDSIFVESSEEVVKERLERVFPEALRKKQERGQCDDDIVIVLAVKNRIIATSVGMVARRKLNFEIVDKVTEFAKIRHLDQGEYAKGLNLMIEIFGKVLTGENYLEVLPSRMERIYYYKLKNMVPSWPVWLTFIVIIGTPAIFVLVLLVLALICALRRYHNITKYGYTNPNDSTYVTGSFSSSMVSRSTSQD
ncbi:unnamed protein product [Bursaphelenchus okinawaensis]|uniref:TPM domain-containing protein n=1 Tax=Bursaphelenchus okinawaensis TaxID=465554 RepID=A0A811JQG4_9BILA|nr:unnamed protein product [Bursaphelenchus okinawaensis]CAG9077753.1 unnamed protein product [Bursaphelenchus okinawaensis]